MKPEDFGYVIKNGILAFQKGPLSQWYGAFQGQGGTTQFHCKDGVDYNCCEQYMMHKKAMLFNDILSANKILKEKNPKKQKELGRLVKGYNEKVWEENRFKIVFDGNYYKFTQNPLLGEFLIRTRPNILVEAAPWDKIWGSGTGPTDERTFDKDRWLGLNLLGKANMQVRAII